MWSRALLVAACGAAALAAWPTAASAKQDRCDPPDSRTVAVNRWWRIFSQVARMGWIGRLRAYVLQGSAVMLTFLTLIAAATLGGAVALELTAIVVLAGVALAVIGAANGVRRVVRTFDALLR